MVAAPAECFAAGSRMMRYPVRTPPDPHPGPLPLVHVLLTTTYEPAERAKVQAAHDFSVFGMTAVAAALSGYLQQKAGWSVVNLVVLPAMFVVLSASLWLRRRQSALLQAAE